MQMKWNKSMMIATAIMVPIIFIICILSANKAKEYTGVSVAFMGKAELRNTIEIPLLQASDLEVIYNSKNVKVYPSERDTIVIKEYLLSDKEEAHAKCIIEDGKASIIGGKVSTIVIFGEIGERIEVYLPKEGMKSLNLKTSSGNVRCQDLEAAEILVSTNSGNIDVENASGKFELSASSGNINALQIKGCGTMTANSGNVKVEADEITGDVQLKTGSGNVKLMLPKELSFGLEVQTGSGNISTDFDEMISYNKKGNQVSGTVGTAAECKISAQAGSGNVKITRDN